jgi:hypothetical protein
MASERPRRSGFLHRPEECCHSNRHPHPHGDPDGHCYRDGYSNLNCCDSNGYRNCYRNSGSDSYSYPDEHPYSCSDPNPRAAQR